MTIPKRFTPEEAARGRTEYVEMVGRELIAPAFRAFPSLRSAYLCVAQFWNDEALDQVHFELVRSELDVPDMAAGLDFDTGQLYGEKPDLVNLPTIAKHEFTSWIRLNERFLMGLDEGSEISMFAAFCKEDCDQEMEPGESFTPFALYRPTTTGDGFTVEIVGQMLRPWLDGVKPLDDGTEGISHSDAWDAFAEIYVEGRPGGSDSFATHGESGHSMSGVSSVVGKTSSTPTAANSEKKRSLFGRLFGRKR